MEEVRFLTEEEFYSVKYRDFVKAFHKSRAKNKIKQFEWYKNTKDYVTAVVIVDGEYVGQASAYACDVMIKGLKTTIYWGCDTFLLEQYRGFGYGKKMQKYLYDNVPLFTSVGYTKINGIIKRKCGALKVWSNTFSYYAVSNLVQFLLSKLIKKRNTFKFISIPIYGYLNALNNKKIKLVEESYDSIENEVLNFIEKELERSYDFYVIRDKSYMRWKYINNPTMTYRLLVDRDSFGTIKSIAFVTDAYNAELSSVMLKYTKILDVFIAPDANYTIKDVHISILNYFLDNNIKLDGIVSLFKFNWFGKVSFERDMLTTYKGDVLEKPYISYIDQDLEQML